MGGFFERTENPQRIRSGSAADKIVRGGQNSPPKSKKSPRRTDSDFFGGLADFYGFFHDQKVRRSAAYLWRIRSGFAVDFLVRGGLRRSPQRIHLSPRKLSTWRIRHRSATGPPKSASDPRRYRGGLESAHLIAHNRIKNNKSFILKTNIDSKLSQNRRHSELTKISLYETLILIQRFRFNWKCSFRAIIEYCTHSYVKNHKAKK